jgi:hypothetical protein
MLQNYKKNSNAFHWSIDRTGGKVIQNYKKLLELQLLLMKIQLLKKSY